MSKVKKGNVCLHYTLDITVSHKYESAVKGMVDDHMAQLAEQVGGIKVVCKKKDAKKAPAKKEPAVKKVISKSGGKK
jgi:hypothetical protein